MLERARKRASALGLEVVIRIMGANINRKTTENIQRAGWRIQVEERLSSDIVRWIETGP